MTDVAERLSKPGDGDLVIDADGLVIDAWTLIGSDLMVHLTGGAGWWWSAGDPDVSTNLTEIEAQITASLNSAVPELLALYDDYLNRWTELRAPLRFCWARGRLGTLIASPSEWLPFPFNPYPDGDDV